MEDLNKQNSDTGAESELSNEQAEQVTGGAVDSYMYFQGDPTIHDEEK